MQFRNELSAGGIVFKKNNEQVLWLIIQSSSHKGWGFPKGLVGDNIRNETYEEGALREVTEEGGIQTDIVSHDPVKAQYMYRFGGYLVKKTVLYYLMQYISGSTEDHDKEVIEAHFVNEKEVKKLLTYKTDLDAFEQILRLYSTLHSNST